MTEAAAKPIAPRPPPVEMKPILGGRLVIGVALLVGIGALANPVLNKYVMDNLAPSTDYHTDASKWRVGNEADVRVTIVTADSTRLSCAKAEVVDGVHCGFGTDRIIWPIGPDTPTDDNGVNLIQPYRTSPDNKLILLAGLWAQPEVAMRLHREPPTGVQAKRLQRFDVTCRVKFLKRFDTVDLRWDVTGNWQPERDAWVARPTNCKVNHG